MEGAKVGRVSGITGGKRGSVCVVFFVCVRAALHWSVQPYRTNTRTSATPLTVTQRTFQVPSLCLQSTLYICHHERERWLWHWDTDVITRWKTCQLACAASVRRGWPTYEPFQKSTGWLETCDFVEQLEQSSSPASYFRLMNSRNFYKWVSTGSGFESTDCEKHAPLGLGIKQPKCVSFFFVLSHTQC